MTAVRSGVGATGAARGDAAGGSPAGRGPAGGGQDVDPRFRRSVDRWSRAYPRRWRRARGEELVGLLADLAGPDATRLDARAVVDVVRGGLATRWREHPPLGAWLRYRLLDVPLPPAYRAWALDDLEGGLWRLRILWPAFALLLVLAVAEYSGGWGSAVRLTLPVAILLAAAFLLPLGWRRQIDLRRHVEPVPGEPLWPGTLVPVPSPRRRLTAAPVAVGAAWSLGVLAAASTAGVLLAPRALHLRFFGADDVTGPGFETFDGPAGDRTGFVVAFAVALLAGLVLAAVAARRVRAQGPVVSWPDQPDRVLVPPSRAGRARAVVWVALLTAPAVAEAVGALAVSWSLVVGCLAWALLPAAVLVGHRVRRSPDLAAAAAVDVARVVTGRSLVPEVPALAFAPWGAEGWSSDVSPQPRPVP